MRAKTEKASICGGCGLNNEEGGHGRSERREEGRIGGRVEKKDMMSMWLLYTDRPGYASRLLLVNIDHVSELWALQLTGNTSVYSAQGRLQKVPCRRRLF